MIFTLKQWARSILGLRKIQEQIISEAQFAIGDKVMDIGCGNGSLLSLIHSRFGSHLEYMGIEPDEKIRSLAEQEHAGKGIKFKRAFADHLPSVQGYYSHVICMVSFHHFPRDKWDVCLNECKRILIPGGKLIIVEFGNPTGIIGRAVSVINTCRRLARGIEPYLKKQAQTIGLELVDEVKQFGYITHYMFTH